MNANKAPLFHRLWFTAFGELPETPSDASPAFVWWICGWAMLGIFIGEFYGISGEPLARGTYRALMHGGVPLVGAALWSGWRLCGRRGGAVLALMALMIPIVWRLTHKFNEFSSPSWQIFAPAVVVLIGSLYTMRSSERSLSEWGMSVGDWRWWLPRVGLAAMIMIPAVWVALQIDPVLLKFYPTWKPARSELDSLLIQQLGIGIDMLGWEFLFRGFLLFALARRGDIHLAIWLQCFPFFLLHGDKPYFELALSSVGGLVSAWFCWRARSFYPLFLLHWLQMASVNVLAVVVRGFV